MWFSLILSQKFIIATNLNDYTYAKQSLFVSVEEKSKTIKFCFEWLKAVK